MIVHVVMYAKYNVGVIISSKWTILLAHAMIDKQLKIDHLWLDHSQLI